MKIKKQNNKTICSPTSLEHNEYLYNITSDYVEIDATETLPHASNIGALMVLKMQGKEITIKTRKTFINDLFASFNLIVVQ